MVFNKYRIKFMREEFGIFAEGSSDTNEYHPVRDYFSHLVWDKVPRIDKFLCTYFGAEDTPANAFIGRTLLIAAVRRVRIPGVKFDNIMVLEGEQGRRKSSAFRALCPDSDWFTDSFSLKADIQDIIYQTKGKLIVEIAELVGIKNPARLGTVT